MAENRQAKTNAQGKKSFGNKANSNDKEIVVKDGHKTIVTKGEKVTVFWKGMEVTDSTHSRPRVGKTLKDRLANAQRRNADNKASRAQWQGDNRASISNFPFNSCNGKRNRTVVTGKGNERVTISYKASGK